MARSPRRFRLLAVVLVLVAVAGGLFYLADTPAPQPVATASQTPVRHEAPATAPKRALPAGADDFAAAFRAGLRNFQQGDAHGAARAFEKAVSIRPHEVQARVNLGFAYIEMKRPAEAEIIFTRALEIAPMTANAYYGLAEALEARGDLPGAIGAMRTYLHLTPAEDPFRRRAMSALWEWRETTPKLASAEPAAGAVAPANPLPDATATGATGVPILDAPLETLDGAPVTLGQHAGKVIVLNIWATWCGPCRAELPSLAQLRAELDPEAFAVIGVSMDKRRFVANEYLRDLGIDFPSYWDGARKLTGEAVDARMIPLTLVISPAGEVIGQHSGARDWSKPELVAAIRQLADRATPVETRAARLREGLQ